MRNVNTRGFTLIELVVVIALLGILAAFAIPRFVSLEQQARIAATRGLEGSVRSAAAMAHGLALATGATASVDMEGNTIDLINGYPDAETIEDTLADTTGFTVTVNGAGDTATFAKDGAAGTCQIEYSEAAAANNAPAIVSNPVDLSTC